MLKAVLVQGLLVANIVFANEVIIQVLLMGRLTGALYISDCCNLCIQKQPSILLKKKKNKQFKDRMKQNYDSSWYSQEKFQYSKRKNLDLNLKPSN